MSGFLTVFSSMYGSGLTLSDSDLDQGVVRDYISGELKRKGRIVSASVAEEYVKNWNAVDTPLDRIWTNMCYAPELNMMVVTSHSTAIENIMITPDGENWTVINAPNSNNIRGIAWSPKLRLFATVASTGTGNRVNTSPDGKVWTARSTPADYYFRDIIWVDELQLFVAVANTTGVTNKVMTSADGENWTMQTCPDRAWSDIVWSPELQLLCVSATGGIAGEKIMTSKDAISWELQSTPADIGASWEGLAWSGALGLFVAVNYFVAGTYDSFPGQCVMTSPDGKNWTLQNTPADQHWLSVDWSEPLGLFAAVSDDNAGQSVMTSLDAKTWVLQTPDTNRDWRRIKWVDAWGCFMAVAYYDGSTPSGKLVMMNSALDLTRQYVVLKGRAQQSLTGKITITDNTTDEAAILDLVSTTRGLVLPRMTTTQRDAIASPMAGLTIYNITTQKINYYTTSWQEV